MCEADFKFFEMVEFVTFFHYTLHVLCFAFKKKILHYAYNNAVIKNMAQRQANQLWILTLSYTSWVTSGKLFKSCVVSRILKWALFSMHILYDTLLLKVGYNSLLINCLLVNQNGDYLDGVHLIRHSFERDWIVCPWDWTEWILTG